MDIEKKKAESVLFHKSLRDAQLRRNKIRNYGASLINHKMSAYMGYMGDGSPVKFDVLVVPRSVFHDEGEDSASVFVTWKAPKDADSFAIVRKNFGEMLVQHYGKYPEGTCEEDIRLWDGWVGTIAWERPSRRNQALIGLLTNIWANEGGNMPNFARRDFFRYGFDIIPINC